ncbi:endoplasmic reticulum metallopeptidase 1-like [Onthophagus taurus]|uniref:endoplasmic reticulum metallopeptidase 1-like n=1 Tax=Onthophagus taurus TaxID=166361 RepID=UPI0039BE23C3
MFYSMGGRKSFQKDEEDHETIAYPFTIIAIAVIVGLYGSIYAIDHNLPTPLYLSDEEANPNSFIAERARDYLKPLVAIGPKVAGHINNEEKAVDYLTNTINDIIAKANVKQKIELRNQVASGSFYLDYKPHGSINTYENIQNVVVKIYGKNDPNTSVLINTHFDTVPTSPGGSDDGINVAVALEVLTKLSQSSEQPTHNVIILFNGAEEAGLIASHAFLSHTWANEVRVLINLEATGAGGKEILFQTGPDKPWLLKYYNVPHPHGNAAGEEVFQSNIIPSDTDFRIFRDYGGYIGYDFAFTRDGYRYHTKYDGFDNIKLGAFQHTGDNILHLTRNLMEAEELDENFTEEDGKMIFYDIFGLFFVHYSETTGVIINSLVIVVSFLLLIWVCCGEHPTTSERGLLVRTSVGFLHVKIFNSFKHIVVLLVITLISWLLAVGIVALIATILDVSHRTMTWYSVPAINFGIYVAPAVAALLIASLINHRYIRNIGLTNSYNALIQVHIVRILWTLVLMVGTIMQLRMSYVLMIGILFNIVAMIISHIIDTIKPKLTKYVWPYVYILSTIIPTMIVYSYGHEVIALFIPILGRFGSGTNPDLLIGLIMALFTIMIASYYVPLFIYSKKPWYIIITILAIFLTGIILICTPVGFPYTFSETNPRLQRFSIYHTMRTIRNDETNTIKHDAGFYFTRQDRNTPRSIEGIVTSLNGAISLEDDCNIAIACGLPISNSRSIKNLENSIWIPTNVNPFDTGISYKYERDQSSHDSPTRRTFSFSVEGSSRIDLYLSIRTKYKLINLSLVEKLPESTLMWNDQPTYYMAFKYGRTAAPFSFKFTVETDSDWSTPVADVAITTKFIDDAKTKKREYLEFLNEFPKWTIFMVTGLAQYENLVIDPLND